MPPARPPLSYCGDQLRRFDHDRYLLALFLPPREREALFTIGAFNLEIAKTREVVREALMGQIRLQWWRDAVDGLYRPAGQREIRHHEVVAPLAGVIVDFSLTREYFDRLIDAREADLADEPPATLDCLINYAEVTNAPLFALGLELLGERGPNAHSAARHLGIAWGLTGLLRAVPFHARSQRRYLPSDRMAHHGLNERRLFELKPGSPLRPLVAELVACARDHLATARTAAATLPRAATRALLAGPLAELYLGTVMKSGCDVFAPRVQMPHPLRPLKIAWHAWRRRI